MCNLQTDYYLVYVLIIHDLLFLPISTIVARVR